MNNIEQLMHDLTGGIKPGDSIWIVSLKKPVRKYCEHCDSMYFEKSYIPKKYTVRSVRLNVSVEYNNPLFWECKIEIIETEDGQPNGRNVSITDVYTNKEKCLEECVRQTRLRKHICRKNNDE